ncbi:MAG: hypothetical protein K9J17_17840 [Flavobacteriales bacterium]|nr:hypothetical protein [Flavobacteriales bacterium]
MPAHKLKKISPGMIRVVDAFAKEVPLHKMAKNENITVHGINKRLKAVRKLLDVYSTSGAYRKLLLARKIELK